MMNCKTSHFYNKCSSVDAIILFGGGGKKRNSAYSYQDMTVQKPTNCYPLDKTLSNKQNQKQIRKPEKSNIFSLNMIIISMSGSI